MSLVCRLRLTSVLMDDSCYLQRTEFTGQREGGLHQIIFIKGKERITITIAFTDNNMVNCAVTFYSVIRLVLLPGTTHHLHSSKLLR